MESWLKDFRGWSIGGDHVDCQFFLYHICGYYHHFYEHFDVTRVIERMQIHHQNCDDA